MTSPRWRRWLIPAIAVVLPLAALEGGLRLALPLLPAPNREFFDQDFREPRHLQDPELFWRLRPGLRTQVCDGGVPYGWEVNKQGFREPGHIAQGKAPGRRRILCLGDSVTFGWLVEQRQAYPAVLGELLEARLGPVEVVNAGVPGYSSHQMRRYLERELLSFAPDAIVTYAGINDAGQALMSDRIRAPLVRAEVTLARLALLRWLRWLVKEGSLALGGGQAPAAVPSVCRNSREDFLDNMSAIARLCDQRGILLAIATPAVLVDGRIAEALPPPAREEDGERLEASWRALVVRHPAPDLVGVMRPHLAEVRRFQVLPEDGCHWNPAGHRLLAAEMARVLAPALLGVGPAPRGGGR